jgi:hypothetical protein
MPPKPSKEALESLFDHKDNGKNITEISKLLKLDRGTVRKYFYCAKGSVERENILKEASEKLIGNRFALASPKDYAYILGLYLGDGHITEMPHKKQVYRLRIFLDVKYQNLNTECKKILSSLFPNNEVNSVVMKHKGNPSCEVIFLYSKDMVQLFPQHGPGKKHTRKIQLEDWQKQIVGTYTEDFLRGLIHSDGSRYSHTDKNGLVRQFYNFTNASIDIMDLFKHYSNKMSVFPRITVKTKSRTSKTQTYIAQINTQSQVAIFDTFIGHKT